MVFKPFDIRRFDREQARFYRANKALCTKARFTAVERSKQQLRYRMRKQHSLCIHEEGYPIIRKCPPDYRSIDLRIADDDTYIPITQPSAYRTANGLRTGSDLLYAAACRVQFYCRRLRSRCCKPAIGECEQLTLKMNKLRRPCTAIIGKRNEFYFAALLRRLVPYPPVQLLIGCKQPPVPAALGGVAPEAYRNARYAAEEHGYYAYALFGQGLRSVNKEITIPV